MDRIKKKKTNARPSIPDFAPTHAPNQPARIVIARDDSPPRLRPAESSEVISSPRREDRTVKSPVLSRQRDEPKARILVSPRGDAPEIKTSAVSPRRTEPKEKRLVLSPRSDKPKGKESATSSTSDRPLKEKDEATSPIEQKLVKRRLPAMVVRTESDRELVFTPRRIPQLDEPKSKAKVKARKPALDIDALSHGDMHLKKLLKGDVTKISCLLDIDNVTYVVKAGAGNGYITDHLVNSDVIHELHLPGVQAPFAERLTPRFRAALTRQLHEAGGPKAQVLIDALGNNDQVATMAPGSTVVSLLSNRDLSKQLIELARGKNGPDAARSLFEKLKVPLPQTFRDDMKALADKVVDSNDQDARTTMIEVLQRELGSDHNQQILSLVSAINTGGVDKAVNDIETSNAELDDAASALKTWVASQEGAAALGSLCVVDLMTGMNDRILEKWNGGNFMFDSAQKNLWCVDNAKNDFGISGDLHAGWKRWFVRQVKGAKPADSLEPVGDVLHFTVYDRPFEDADLQANVVLLDAQRVQTKLGMNDAVREAIDHLQSVVDDERSALTPVMRKRLAARLQVLQDRVSFVNMCQIDPDFMNVNAAPAQDGFIDKTKRKVQSRSELQELAKALKNDARSGKVTAQKLIQLENTLLRAQNAEGIADVDRDRRIDKALFEAKFARFLLHLKDKENELVRISGIPDEHKVWGVGAGETVTKRMDVAIDLWRGKLLGAKNKGKLQDAQQSLTKAASLLG